MSALTPEQINEIRYKYDHLGMTMEDLADAYHRNRKTISYYLNKKDFSQSSVTQNIRRSSDKPESSSICPEDRDFIRDILIKDRKAPRKQRHTDTRIFDRLRKEKGYKGSYATVNRCVKKLKKELGTPVKDHNSGVLPLDHKPYEAQADFGHTVFIENGIRVDGRHFVLSFPTSNLGFVQLTFGENIECLMECMTAIFNEIGGVPQEIWFDNASCIVKEVLKGPDRKVYDRFMCFANHYGFHAVFMNRGKGCEKGNAESKIRYTRSNFMVPIPEFQDLDTYNRTVLIRQCYEDGERKHYRKEKYISELFRDNQECLLPLPQVPFSLPTIRIGVKTNNYGIFTLEKGKHAYSTSPKYSDSYVNVKVTSRYVVPMNDKMEEIVIHDRLYGEKNQQSIQWLPYLHYICRHPRSLGSTGIMEMFPDDMQLYMKNIGYDETVRILKALSDLYDRIGFEHAVEAIHAAIIAHTTDQISLNELVLKYTPGSPAKPEEKDGIPGFSFSMDNPAGDIQSLEELMKGCSING